jgi:hypothetical protein
MLKKIAVLALLVAIGLIGAMANSQLALGSSASDFIGTWVNVDPNTRDTTKFIIADAATGLLSIQGFGKCHPSDCDFGVTALNLIASNVGDTNFSYAIARWDFGFADNTFIVHFEGDQLLVESFTVFKDNSGRSNYRSVMLFKRG